MYCRDCRYYESQNGQHAAGTMTCSSPLALQGYYHKVEALPENGVMIENDEGWGWLVGPMFGCVNFEQKE